MTLRKVPLLVLGIAMALLSACQGSGAQPATGTQPAGGSQPTAGASGQSVADFYRGKTITIIVGYAPGGGYDTTARVLAKYFGSHLPGNPTVEVQNMDGAGSLIAANHLYNVDKPDGLTMGIFNELQ